MSSNNDLNFGPVFMRGRKPAPGFSKSIAAASAAPLQQAPSSQHQPSPGAPAPVMKPQMPLLGSFGPGTNAAASALSKSFSAAVSPGKEAEERSKYASPSNVWDPQQPSSLSVESNTSHVSNGTMASGLEYSRETLLNLYAEDLAAKLPPDLKLSNSALSSDLVGPPMGLIDMSENERELFTGPYNSERRAGASKQAQHSNVPEISYTLPLSPDGANVNSVSSKFSVGSAVKLGKHGPTDRFSSLGIQGGVLAGVASTGLRRRGDSENDSFDGNRRFSRPDDPSAGSTWASHPRDRRNRDHPQPLSDGKWKRGLSLEDRALASTDGVAGNHAPKYSVLDKMREKAAFATEVTSRETAEASRYGPDHAQDGVIRSSGRSPPASVHSVKQSDLPTVLSSRESREDNVLHSSGAHISGDLRAASPSRGISTSPVGFEPVPEDIAWQYRDPTGTVQGPFTAFQMQEWYKATFFRDDLLVKRITDSAFETLETLILRVGDRDRPFLARPPPALPPNLPLPVAHRPDAQSPNSLQPTTSAPISGLADHYGNLAHRTEGLSILDASLSNSSANNPAVNTTLDPWNVRASVASTGPSHQSGSSPLSAAAPWDSTPPTYVHPNPLLNPEFNSSLVGSGLLPHAFTQPDALRYLHQVRLPPISMAQASGYPFPMPLPNQPSFGQIPAIHSLPVGSALDPLSLPPNHPQMNIPSMPFAFNRSAGGGPDVEQPPQFGHSEQSSVAHIISADPWHNPNELPAPPQPTPVDLGHVHATKTNQSAAGEGSFLQPPNNLSHLGLDAPLIPIGPRSPDIGNPTSASHVLSTTAANISSTAEQLPPNGSVLENDATASSEFSAPLTPAQVPAAPSSVAEKALTIHTEAGDPLAPVNASSWADPSTVPGKPSNLDPQEVSASNCVVERPPPRPLGTQAEAIHSISQLNGTDLESSAANPSSDHNWQLVKGQAATRVVHPPAPANIQAPASKSSGKVVVMSRAQQEEQDRRTASIQKTQLQLKEAQAVERAAREAAEAAAAAAVTSVNTPAPWSKEDKVPTSHLSLSEIQAIESKQAEKQRLAEKQAAANRAIAEKLSTAERPAKSAKEALPPSTNWAPPASSPAKIQTSNAVWGSKEAEGSLATALPKQSMKQIQEEEARKKKMALQQQAKTAATASGTRSGGGYAGTVANSKPKPAVGSPWFVVGAKSKVVAPPTNVGRSVQTTNAAVPGLPHVNRTSVVANSATRAAQNHSASTKASKPPGKSALRHAASNSHLGSGMPQGQLGSDGPPPASPEFMKWLREALRGMNNVDDFVKMLLDFPINPDASVLEIVSDSVYAGSATLDGRRFAKEFNTRRNADVAARLGGSQGKSMTSGLGKGSASGSGSTTGAGANATNAATGKKTSMADAIKSSPVHKNDGWGFAVVGPKKKKK